METQDQQLARAYLKSRCAEEAKEQADSLARRSELERREVFIHVTKAKFIRLHPSATPEQFFDAGRKAFIAYNQ